jgi:hypothetical protein
MLTKDRIAAGDADRSAHRRSGRAVGTVPDVDAWLYRLVQFGSARRSSRTLDEVLSAKNALDAGRLRARASRRPASSHRVGVRT